MSDALEYQLDSVLQGVLQRTLPAARKTLARELAAGLRSRQAARIRRQQDPDGTPLTPRKQKKITLYPGRLRFRWCGPSGMQIREICNWRNTFCRRGARAVTGFDPVAGGFRTFRREDIEDWLVIELNKTAVRRRLQRAAMFEQLRTRRFLRTDATPDQATVGFTGHTADIAAVHQYGRIDRVAGHSTTRYPVRRILGFTEDDIHWLGDKIISFIAGQ